MSATSSPGVELLVRAVLAAASALEDAQDELCRLDSVAGDGDEGFAMASAARGIRAELAKSTPADVGTVLSIVAAQFAGVGGTMGALSFVLLQSLGQVAGIGTSPLDATLIAALLGAAEDSVSSFGGAKRGDKTLVDAIAAARDTAEACAREAAATSETLVRSAEAAAQAAAKTADMVARIGRASRLSEKSRGTVDPGALSFAIALSAVARAYGDGQSASQNSPTSDVASADYRGG